MSKKNEEKRGTVKVGGRISQARLGIIVLLIVSGVLMLICVAGAFFFMNKIGYTKSEGEQKTVYIRSGEDFIEQMRSRLVVKEYCLLSDIEIDAEEWNNTMSDVILRGSLNGNGNVVRINGTLKIPLFKNIDANATVCNVAFTGVKLNGEDAVSSAILALVNHGTVSNCSITEAMVTVDTEQYAALFVAHNFGKIEKCVANGIFVTGDGSVAGRTAVGSVAAINYKNAEINSCVVEIEYDDGFKAIKNEYFNESEVNDKLGYAVGQNNGTISLVYCLNATDFSLSSDGKTENDVHSIEKEELTPLLLSSAGFIKDLWELNAGQLPKLKVIMGAEV